jgi:alpha-1,3-rhamnosyl/mannosyltransferase
MATRVGVNLLWCVPGKVGGSEEYLTRQLLGLHELAAAGDAFAGDLRLVAYALPGYAEAHPDVADAVEVVTAPVNGSSRAARIAAEHSWLAGRTRHDDLVHHGGGTVPAVGKRPVVLTVHDLQYLAYPQYFTATKLAYLRRQMPRSVRRADVVTVPSEYVRQTVVDSFGVHPERVVVVRHGLEPSIGSTPTPEHVLRDRFGLGRARVLSYVAVTYPHKRHDFLLELMATRWTDPNLKLVLAGGAGLADAAVERQIAALGLSDRVVRPGRVGPDDRDGLIQLSEALVFPSEYEGFGAPLIEAMALGTPIVASDRTAVPEVLGNAGLSLPLDVGAWAGALDEVARRRSELVGAGRRRVVQFTAARSAGDLLTAYRRALA